MARFTKEQYQTFLARTSPAAVVAGLTSLTAVEHEADLHEAIRQECAARGWMAFHGSMAHRTRRTAGEPDFVILCDKGRTLYIECKGRQTKISTEQRGVIAWAEKLGHAIHIVRSVEEFRQLISELNL